MFIFEGVNAILRHAPRWVKRQPSPAIASRPASMIRALATAISFPPDWTFSGAERPAPRICNRHVVDFNPSAACYYGLVVPRGQPGAEEAS
jgi:hypothetical protein